MTTAITIQDIMDAIDAEPEMLDALRARLLTRELLELPEKFAAFQAATAEFQAATLAFQDSVLAFQKGTLDFQKTSLGFQKGTLEFQETTLEFQKTTLEFQKTTVAFQEATLKRFDGIDRRFDGVDTRFDGVDTRFDGVDTRFDGVDRRFDGVDARFDGMDRRFDGMDRRFAHLTVQVNRLNGLVASLVGVKFVPSITRRMGYRFRRALEPLDLVNMTYDCDTAGIPEGDLDSFVHADAVAETTDGEGRKRYVAIEFSHTAQKRDVDRAIRNARFLARFTGAPASAAVSGIQMADEIRGAVDAGDVFWHEMPMSALQPE